MPSDISNVNLKKKKKEKRKKNRLKTKEKMKIENSFNSSLKFKTIKDDMKCRDILYFIEDDNYQKLFF